MMAERINVQPDALRQASREHRDTAEFLGSVPLVHNDIMASLESLGPIFSDLCVVGRELLENRRLCYEAQAQAHAELAENLNYAAQIWEHHDISSARDLGDIGQGTT